MGSSHNRVYCGSPKATELKNKLLLYDTKLVIDCFAYNITIGKLYSIAVIVK